MYPPKRREIVDLGFRRTAGAYARVPSPETLVLPSALLCPCLSVVLSRLALPELWLFPRPVGAISLSETTSTVVGRLVGRRGRLEAEVLFRGMKATKAPSSPAHVSGGWLGFFSNASSVLSPGGTGFHSLVSSDLVELSGGPPKVRVGLMGLFVGTRGSLKSEETSKKIEDAPRGEVRRVEGKWSRWWLYVSSVGETMVTTLKRRRAVVLGLPV
ncbi:hypothetical protein YC2023_027977 [Brassica napus]